MLPPWRCEKSRVNAVLAGHSPGLGVSFEHARLSLLVHPLHISGLQTLEVLWQFVLSSIKLPLVLACPAFLAASSTFHVLL
jgi:hypothetical protein